MAMSNSEQFQIIYDGPALESNEMDVRDLAPALLAVGDLLEEANRIICGGNSRVNVNVKGSFKTGSFQVDFSIIQNIIQQIINFAGSPDGATTGRILAFLGINVSNVFGLIPLIKWIKNRKITKVTKIGDSKVTVEIDDDKIETEEKVIDLYRDTRIREALEVIINKPLQKAGVDQFGIRYQGQIVSVNGAESEYFRMPETPDEILEDRTTEVNLQLVTISFQEDNKWRFSDGASTFYATVLDRDFIQKVQASTISFTKGDILRVILRKKQVLTNAEMKTDYYVIRVLGQRSPAKQIPLPF